MRFKIYQNNIIYDIGMSEAYYTFHYLFTGKNHKRFQLHSLSAFVHIMLAMKADPIFVREELLARGYDIPNDMIRDCEVDKMPSEPNIYMKWISAITEGVVQSRYGYQKLARALGIPIAIANAEYDARHTSDHIKRPVNDMHNTATSLSLPNLNVSQLPSLSAAPEKENRYHRT